MKRFKKLYIEITNVCNMSCEFCPTTKREPRFMGVDEFNYILDQVKDYTDYIYFHVKGEPLLHPDLSTFLDLAAEKGFKANITTNGTLIQDRKDVLINKLSLRQINISLHSLDGNPQFKNGNKYINDILDFIEEAKEIKSLIVALRLWNLSSIDSDNDNKNKVILNRLEESLGFKYYIGDGLSPVRGIKIRDRLYLNEDIEFIWPDLNNEMYSDNGFCYGLRDQLGILVDGTVIPCCLDGEGKINLGNIHNDNLSTILQSYKAKNIYNGFSNRNVVEDLCKKCGYRMKFDTSNVN